MHFFFFFFLTHPVQHIFYCHLLKLVHWHHKCNPDLLIVQLFIGQICRKAFKVSRIRVCAVSAMYLSLVKSWWRLWYGICLDMLHENFEALLYPFLFVTFFPACIAWIHNNGNLRCSYRNKPEVQNLALYMWPSEWRPLLQRYMVVTKRPVVKKYRVPKIKRPSAHRTLC